MALPVPMVLYAGKDVKEKAKMLVDSEETQVWLLATAAETDQLREGLVPEDIRRQARVALDMLHDAQFGLVSKSGSRTRKKSKKGE